MAWLVAGQTQSARHNSGDAEPVESAEERAGEGPDNKGREAAQAVLEMIRFEWEVDAP